ncbi:hypothetical protein KGR20_09900 [Cytobacillus oceanisediminis]|uniref:YhfM-like domain-containing protein n=1 Tax=Niallia alba TaxID=2729105 RepID=A0A7Y0K6D6_9BACI|nr:MULTISPECIES: hypothetical protein [Bacillaceae]EOR24610.1 hypothetical protein A499_07605 [Niallia nealsonii AAU1]MBZ9534569.1 hypothetical protein [Cytobacillus oceanisediminis]NMO76059.1 hypothetical protein [Niallia alba]UTI43861.1 hypothetical protein NKG37_09540 [Niallia sp. RD1]
MKVIFSILTILCVAIALIGCQLQQEETMVLLDGKISEIKISESNGTGEMNEEIILSIKDDESLDVFEKAITTAVKQPGEVKISEPDYDVMVEYEAEEGGLPTHGIHLWLGKENEKSTFMYITDDSIYLTSPQMTKELRRLILSK